MKKIILGIVFVFATVTMVNANTESASDCFADAWRYGTETAASYGGDEEDEWYWMDVYYSNFCEVE